MVAVTYCGNCGAANPPGAAFCARCGAPLPRLAAAAQVAPPVAGAPAPAYAGAYVYPQWQQVPYRRAVVPKTPIWVWFLAGGAILFFMVVLALVALIFGPSGPTTCTGQTCVKPHLAPALGPPHTYTSSSLGYSVEYYDHPELNGHVKVAGQDDHSITWEVATKSGTFPWLINGDRAGGRSAQQMVETIQQQKFADAQYLYTIPGVTFGATPGYGNVYRIALQASGGQTFEGRLVIAAAVKNDVAVELLAVGPYVKSTPADGHPNPSNTFITVLADETIKFVYWKGDAQL